MLASISGLSFFDLSSDPNFKRNQLDEFYYLSRHAHFSYGDMLKMPVFERKYFINKLIEEFEKKNEAYEKAKNSKN